jgi:hypothetical protein
MIRAAIGVFAVGLGSYYLQLAPLAVIEPRQILPAASSISIFHVNFRLSEDRMSFLRERAWSPYLAGVLIGLLQIPTFLLMDTALGASSSYVTVAAQLAAQFDSNVGDIKYLADHMWGAKNWWQVAVVAGIAAGAFLSKGLSGARRHVISPVWSRTMGTATLSSRAPIAFLAGFVMLFGARIAGGCTSGHGISGMAQLSVGSTLAVAAMFAGGILTANLLMKRA